MTATYNESVSAPTQGATGRIARVIGPVVDVEFPAGQVPEIYNALTTELTLDGRTRTITFETAQHLGDSIVRAISLQQTDGLVRGQAVVDTGAPISTFSVTHSTCRTQRSRLTPTGRFTVPLPASQSWKAPPKCWRPVLSPSTF